MDEKQTGDFGERREQILIAEDNDHMRAYVHRLLAPNYDVRACSNGAEALAAARVQTPGLVIADIMMPGLDGFELLRELRTDPITAMVPVILLSGRAGEDERVEGMGAGADDYIVKPFSARELVARVRAHLSMSRLRANAAEREHALRAEAEAAHARVVAILETISDAFIALDPKWQFTYFNAEAERITKMSRSDVLGRILWDVFPEARNTEHYHHLLDAMEGRKESTFESLHARGQRWFENRLYPASDGGISVFSREITGRKQAEAALRKANGALRRANADLEQFAYSAAHDLREPLRTVRLYADLLSRQHASALGASAAELLEYCRAGAQRMDSLLTDLLGYARVSMGPGADDLPEPVPLDAALAVALRNLQATIEETGAEISCAPLPTMRIARFHAEQLFQNLIGNSLKYRSEDPPTIHVSARNDGETWTISVEDNGIGIAPEYHHQVFGIFKRLHNASEYGGSGVGLSICKKIVERYGGDIHVDSEPGRGSKFYFSIPHTTGRVHTSSA